MPDSLAALPIGMPHADLRAARPASQFSFGIGRVEEAGGWTAFYFFGDTPAPPGMPLAEVVRREPGPAQRLQRAEYRRAVPADSAEALWGAAVARAQRAAGAGARCTRFEVPGWGPGRPAERRGLVATVPLPAAGAPPARVRIGFGGALPGAAGTRDWGGPPRAGFQITVEGVPEDDVAALFETDAVPCPPPASALGPARATPLPNAASRATRYAGPGQRGRAVHGTPASARAHVHAPEPPTRPCARSPRWRAGRRGGPRPSTA